MIRRLAFLVLLISCRSQSIPPITFHEDFEKPDFRENWDWIDTCCVNSIVRTDSISRTGRFALRIELNRQDTTEAGLNMTDTENNMQDMDNTQHWWVFTKYLPFDFRIDSVYEIFGLWLPQIDACETPVASPVMLNV